MVYSEGYDLHCDVANREKIAKACQAVKGADVVLVYAGLPEEYEAEGFDRQHTRMPDSHNQLIEALSNEHDQVVVVLSGGSAMEMPWIGGVKGVVNGILGGQAGAGGVVDVLDGTVNPSGKLSETYPLKGGDNPTANYFPGGQVTTEHRESVYIGYRYYETAKKDVLFPFGFGLSYTQFAYSDLKLSANSIRDTDTLRVTFKVKNTGDRDGAEVAQLYVADRESTIFRPVKELKGFKKVWLKAGEEKEVALTLDKRAFAYYNVNLADWHVESGKFDILIGANIRDIKLQAEVGVTSTVEADIPDYRETAPSYYAADVQNVPDKEFSAVLGHDIPAAVRRPGERITLLNSLEDAADTKWGGRICRMVLAVMSRTDTSSIAGSESGAGMLEAMALQIPIRNFVQMSGGVFSEKMAEGLILMLNDEAPVKGVGKILAGVPRALTQIKTLISAI
ncbi:MAG: glycoside hydrolase family 3 C-terminal domain-containing protein [Clostridiales bacterium]|nr:glycoside hydrolase family 3 C-terminal domain-containing protein [Clostridiales bacterium]